MRTSHKSLVIYTHITQTSDRGRMNVIDIKWVFPKKCSIVTKTFNLDTTQDKQLSRAFYGTEEHFWVTLYDTVSYLETINKVPANKKIAKESIRFVFRRCFFRVLSFFWYNVNDTRFLSFFCLYC